MRISTKYEDIHQDKLVNQTRIAVGALGTLLFVNPQAGPLASLLVRGGVQAESLRDALLPYSQKSEEAGSGGRPAHLRSRVKERFLKLEGLMMPLTSCRSPALDSRPY